MATSEGLLRTKQCNPVTDWHPIRGGIMILIITSCYRIQKVFRPPGLQAKNPGLQDRKIWAVELQICTLGLHLARISIFPGSK